MTVETFDPSNASISMTEAAIKHFDGILNKNAGKFIRLATEKSGCSGFAYVLDMADQLEPNDIVFHPSDAITLGVAADAIAVLNGTEIDMLTEGVNKVVKFNNPNVTGECGCGESFSVS